jgi:hypothetical protein
VSFVISKKYANHPFCVCVCVFVVVVVVVVVCERDLVVSLWYLNCVTLGD